MKSIRVRVRLCGSLRTQYLSECSISIEQSMSSVYQPLSFGYWSSLQDISNACFELR
jgi:hypothetical protein